MVKLPKKQKKKSGSAAQEPVVNEQKSTTELPKEEVTTQAQNTTDQVTPIGDGISLEEEFDVDQEQDFDQRLEAVANFKKFRGLSPRNQRYVLGIIAVALIGLSFIILRFGVDSNRYPNIFDEPAANTAPEPPVELSPYEVRILDSVIYATPSGSGFSVFSTGIAADSSATNLSQLASLPTPLRQTETIFNENRPTPFIALDGDLREIDGNNTNTLTTVNGSLVNGLQAIDGERYLLAVESNGSTDFVIFNSNDSSSNTVHTTAGRQLLLGWNQERDIFFYQNDCGESCVGKEVQLFSFAMQTEKNNENKNEATELIDDVVPLSTNSLSISPNGDQLLRVASTVIPEQEDTTSPTGYYIGPPYTISVVDTRLLTTQQVATIGKLNDAPLDIKTGWSSSEVGFLPYYSNGTKVQIIRGSTSVSTLYEASNEIVDVYWVSDREMLIGTAAPDDDLKITHFDLVDRGILPIASVPLDTVVLSVEFTSRLPQDDEPSTGVQRINGDPVIPQ